MDFIMYFIPDLKTHFKHSTIFIQTNRLHLINKHFFLYISISFQLFVVVSTDWIYDLKINICIWYAYWMIALISNDHAISYVIQLIYVKLIFIFAKVVSRCFWCEYFNKKNIKSNEWNKHYTTSFECLLIRNNF